MAEPTTTDILNQENRNIELSEDIGIAQEHEAKIKARDNDFGFSTKEENQSFKEGWDAHNNEQMEIYRQEDEMEKSVKDQHENLSEDEYEVNFRAEFDESLKELERGAASKSEPAHDELAAKITFEIRKSLDLKGNDPSLNEFVNSKLKALSAERKVEAQLFKIGYEPINLLDLSKKESQRIEAIKTFDKAPRDFVKNSNILSTKAERLIESTVKQRHAEIGLNDLLENSSIKNIDTYKEAWTSDLKTENSNLQVAKEELSFYSKWQQGDFKAPLLSTVEEKMNKDNLSLNNQEQILSKIKDKINSEKSISTDKPQPVKEDEMER